MNKTKIDWCDSTWNPISGCLHGCEYCYARGIAERFRPFDFPHLTEKGVYEKLNELDSPIITACKDGKDRICAYPFGFEPTFHRYRLNEYRNKKGRNIFVCSMADLFGVWVPDEWIEEIFEACDKAPQHNYLFLTKNPERYAELGMPCDSYLWHGTSVCKKEDIPKCKYLPLSGKKFVSIEPILGDLEIIDSPLINYVDWVIIGAETGRRKNKVVPERKWIEDIVNECRENQVPVFMKSSLAGIWGEPLIQEFPVELRR